MEESDAYYDQLIEDTESYWDGMIEGIEEYQTRWEELADLEEEAKMNAALKELGMTTEDILNMSEEEFENFKKKYLAILTEIYAGNEDVLGALQEASGISVESLKPLIEELQKTLEKTDKYSESAGNAKTETEEFSVEVDNTGDSLDKMGDSADDTSKSIDDVSTSADGATTSIGNLNTELEDTPSTEGYDAIADAIGRIKGVADAVCESVKKATTELNLFRLAKDTLESGAKVADNVLQAGVGVAQKIVTGKAYASGTEISGLDHDEKNALRSEYGQKELAVYPNGDTELTTSPVMSDLPKGTVVYNEEQTEKILDNKPIPVGNAYADGTDNRVIITPDGRVLRHLQPGDRMYDMLQKWNKYFDNIDRNIEKLTPNSTYERNMQMQEVINQINNSSVVNKNSRPVINQEFNISLPNVTNSTSAEALMNDLQSLSTKKYQVDW